MPPKEKARQKRKINSFIGAIQISTMILEIIVVSDFL